MKPGIYSDLSFDDYRKIDAVNQSFLKALKKSPAHAKYYQSCSGPDTKELQFGRAFHTSALEPGVFPKRYGLLPRFPTKKECGRTIEEQEIEYRAKNPGMEFISQDDMDKIREMSFALDRHETASSLITQVQTEVTLVWKDSETSILCKARLDGINHRHKSIIDLKTTQSASTTDFAKSIYRYSYHNQAAWYLEGYRSLEGTADHFVFVAIEKDAPYGIQLFRIKEEALSVARLENRELLRLYAECKQKDWWPSYSEGVVDIGLPSWGMKGEEDALSN